MPFYLNCRVACSEYIACLGAREGYLGMLNMMLTGCCAIETIDKLIFGKTSDIYT